MTHPAPVITSLSPQFGSVGDKVVIKGSNFSSTIAKDTVTFNGTIAKVISASETRLKTIVPKGASTGPVKVTVYGKTSNGLPFTIKSPNIATITNFSSHKKEFHKVTAVKYSWKIDYPGKIKNLTCKLDTDGDGNTEYTIDSCPRSGSKVWLYRRMLKAVQVHPQLIVAVSGGNNTSKTLNKSIQVSARRIADLAANALHALALDNKGHVTAWGKQAPITNIPNKVQGKTIAIATAKHNSIFLTQNHDVIVIGRNGANQRKVPNNIQGHVVDISAGQGYVVALLENGTVRAWGFNKMANVPSGLKNVVAITSGRHESIALKADGTIVAWGGNHFGQSSPPEELAKKGNIVEIGAAFASCQVLKFNNSVSGWGRPKNGADTPPSDLGKVVEIASGGFHHLALQADGTIREWGRDKGPVSLKKPGIKNVIGMSTAFQYGLALQADGTVVGWGSGKNNQENVPKGLDLIK